MSRELQSQIDKLYRRMLMAVAPTLIAATDDSGPIHKVQVSINGTPETIDNVGVMQIYGLASHAPPGTDATALFMGGLRSNPVIVATGNQEARLKNQKPGEISLYSDEGDAISLKRGNNVAITTKTATIAGSDKITLSTPLTELSRDLTAQGKIDAAGGFYQNGVPIGGAAEIAELRQELAELRARLDAAGL